MAAVADGEIAAGALPPPDAAAGPPIGVGGKFVVGIGIRSVDDIDVAGIERDVFEGVKNFEAAARLVAGFAAEIETVTVGVAFALGAVKAFFEDAKDDGDDVRAGKFGDFIHPAFKEGNVAEMVVGHFVGDNESDVFVPRTMLEQRAGEIDVFAGGGKSGFLGDPGNDYFKGLALG